MAASWVCSHCGKRVDTDGPLDPAHIPEGWAWQEYRSHRYAELEERLWKHPSKMLGCSPEHAFWAASKYGEPL